MAEIDIMGKKLNIFGGIKVWGRFTFTWTRAFSFKWMKEWDAAAWFWFILLGSIIGMGTGAVIVAAIGDPTPVVPTQGGWNG